MAIISGVIKGQNLILGEDNKEYIFESFDIVGHKTTKINDRVRFTPNGFNATKISVQSMGSFSQNPNKENIALADISEPFKEKQSNTKKEIKAIQNLTSIRINGFLSSLLLVAFAYLFYNFFDNITTLTIDILAKFGIATKDLSLISLQAIALLGICTFHVLPLFKATLKLWEASKNDYYKKSSTNYFLFLFLAFGFSIATLYFKLFNYTNLKFIAILSLILVLMIIYKAKLFIAIAKNTRVWSFALALVLEIAAFVGFGVVIFVDNTYLDISIIVFIVAHALYAVSFFMIKDIANETKNIFLKKQYGFL